MKTLAEVKATTIGEYFGTLLESVTQAHIDHLRTGKYAKHIALNEYYDEAPDLIDDIIEHYQGINGIVEGMKNNIELSDELGAIEYLTLLREFTKEGAKDFFKEDDSELFGDVDTFVSLIDSTLYKLKELKESKEKQIKSLSGYLKESLI